MSAITAWAGAPPSKNSLDGRRPTAPGIRYLVPLGFFTPTHNCANTMLRHRFLPGAFLAIL